MRSTRKTHWSTSSVQEKNRRHLAASLEPDLQAEILRVAPFFLLLAFIFTPLALTAAFTIYLCIETARAARQEKVLRNKIAALSEVITLLDGRIKTAMADRSDNLLKIKSLKRRSPPFSHQRQNLPTRTNHAPHGYKTGPHKIPSHVKVYS